MIQPSPLLLPLAHERGQAFSHHHYGWVNGGTHQVGHDRGIDDAQSLQTMHLAVLIDYGHRVRPWPHLARPRDVRIGGGLAQQPCVKRRIRGHIGSSRLQQWPDDLFKVIVLRQGEGETDASAQTLPVKGVSKVVVVQAWLDPVGQGRAI